ncbi:MAG: ATP-binding cassette domain-containing protein [Rhizomicrobium sp.]
MDELVCAQISVEFMGLAVLRNVSFEIAPGSIVGLIGPNGSGKTTLLNTISGHVKPKTGVVRFGQKLTGKPRDRLAQLGIFRSFQDARLFESMTGEENVVASLQPSLNEGVWTTIFAPSRNEKIALERNILLRSILDRLGVGEERSRPVVELSYGMRKRILLAQALAARPVVSLLDEPLAGVDPKTRPRMISAIQQLRTEQSIVIWVEHDFEAICSVADRLLVLDRGELVADGNPQEVIASPIVRDLYFRPV